MLLYSSEQHYSLPAKSSGQGCLSLRAASSDLPRQRLQHRLRTTPLAQLSDMPARQPEMMASLDQVIALQLGQHLRQSCFPFQQTTDAIAHFLMTDKHFKPRITHGPGLDLCSLSRCSCSLESRQSL